MYKKITILLILLISTSYLAKSQSVMGLTGGVNFSHLSGDYEKFYPDGSPIYFEKVSRKGLYGGLIWDIKIKKGKLFRSTMLQTGILYSQQGAIYRNSRFATVQDTFQVLNIIDSLSLRNANAEITQSFYRSVDYITVPLIWKQHWGEVYTKLGVYGQIGILTDSATTKVYKYPTVKVKYKGTSDKFLQNDIFYDLGVSTGLGFQTSLNNEYDFFLDFSYRFGFLKVDKETYRAEDIMRNSLFTISTGIIIFGKQRRHFKR